MKHKTTAVRLVGALLMAVALLPWVSGTAAQAAVTVHLDQKWIGTSATDAGLNHADCNYDEINQVHTGTGWHFVLPGGSGLTSFTAFFQTAGAVTVTTTETAAGVIVQDGKGAVIYTNTADKLVAGASGFPGDGTADSGDIMQLSHICTGTPTSPPPSSPPVTTTTPAAPGTTTAAASPSASVQGVKNAKPPAVLPKTGSGMSLGTALAVSLGFLLAGAALMSLPRRLGVERKRRH